MRVGIDLGLVLVGRGVAVRAFINVVAAGHTGRGHGLHVHAEIMPAGIGGRFVQVGRGVAARALVNVVAARGAGGRHRFHKHAEVVRVGIRVGHVQVRFGAAAGALINVVAARHAGRVLVTDKNAVIMVIGVDGRFELRHDHIAAGGAVNAGAETGFGTGGGHGGIRHALVLEGAVCRRDNGILLDVGIPGPIVDDIVPRRIGRLFRQRGRHGVLPVFHGLGIQHVVVPILEGHGEGLGLPVGDVASVAVAALRDQHGGGGPVDAGAGPAEEVVSLPGRRQQHEGRRFNVIARGVAGVGPAAEVVGDPVLDRIIGQGPAHGIRLHVLFGGLGGIGGHVGIAVIAVCGDGHGVAVGIGLGLGRDGRAGGALMRHGCGAGAAHKRGFGAVKIRFGRGDRGGVRCGIAERGAGTLQRGVIRIPRGIGVIPVHVLADAFIDQIAQAGLVDRGDSEENHTRRHRPARTFIGAYAVSEIPDVGIP